MLALFCTAQRQPIGRDLGGGVYGGQSRTDPSCRPASQSFKAMDRGRWSSQPHTGDSPGPTSLRT